MSLGKIDSFFCKCCSHAFFNHCLLLMHSQKYRMFLFRCYSALGVSGHPHPLLNHFAGLLTMGEDELKAHIMSREQTNPVSNAIRAAEVRIALIRGISVD